MFTHLHLHTQYSLLNGAIRIADLPAALKKQGYKSCAITDTGSIAGVVEFYTTMKKAGLKPLLGMEAFVSRGPCTERKYSRPGPNASSLVLICQNRVGYQNLMKLSSLSYAKGKYYVPRVDRQLLETHQEGLIAISWGAKGVLGKQLRQKQTQEAQQIAKWLSEAFDQRFYVGLQNQGLTGQTELNAQLLELAEAMSLPLVAGNDCFYLRAEESESQHLLRLIGKQKTLANIGKAESDQFYLRSPQEMEVAMRDYPPEALTNSELIVASCDLGLENDTVHLPRFDLPAEATDENSWLKKLGLEHLEKKLARLETRYAIPPEQKDSWQKNYHQRLKHELDVICCMKYSGYFLIVADFINWAKQNGVRVGPGRGSGAGSLTAYVLGITGLDPIYHGLLFERFLNPERVSMPDFDVDFDVEGREQVLEYVRGKYGRDKVCQITTYGTLAAKAVIRNVARVLDFSYNDADKIARLIPDKLGITLGEAVKTEPELEKLEKEGTPVEKELMKHARVLEGLHSTQSTHAAGVIIMDSPIDSVIPTCTDKSGHGIQSQFAMKWVEHQGGVKFDFLGLNNLTIINHALELINLSQPEGTPKIDIDSIPIDDPKVFKLLMNGETTGIFQLESSGMRRLLMESKPDCFSDIAAILALYRPGPLESGMTHNFIERKNGRQEIQSPHPKLEELLRETKGVMAYQEQVMQAARILAGFSLGEADLLRRAMGKKDPVDMQQHRERFVKGCLNNEITEQEAQHIFDQIDKFAGYGFNKSHSVAYGMIAYQTAWLKANHPVAFMCALLSGEMHNTDRVVNNIVECREMGIEVLAPDINESQVSFSIQKNAVRFGLNAVRNVGSAAAQEIVETRLQQSQQKFTNLQNFLQQINPSLVNKRALESLIQCGSLDALSPNRASLLEVLPTLMQVIQHHQQQQQQGQENIFQLMDSGQAQELDLNLPECAEMESHQRLQLEKKALGFYISGHPLNTYSSELKQLTSNIHDLRELERPPTKGIQVAGIIQSHKVRLNRKAEKYASVRLMDTRSSIDLMVFSSLYAKSAPLLESDEPLLVHGKLQKQEKDLQLNAEWITTLASYREKHAELLNIKLSSPTEDLIPKLAEIISQLPKGICRIELNLETPTSNIQINSGYAITPSFENIREISALLPQEEQLEFYYPSPIAYKKAN